MTTNSKMPNNNIKNSRCWICESSDIFIKKPGFHATDLQESQFAITDANYGTTLSIYQCQECSFLFCPEAGDVTAYYAALEDQSYLATREERKRQARKILDQLKAYKPKGKLLDIGAGSGILVEEAIKQNYQALGIEPSKSFINEAQKLSLPIIEGIFPNDRLGNSQFDIITLIDVLEHVHQPLQLLKDIAIFLVKDGIAVITTPDINSIMAKLLGKKWWHYRIAHISYFSKHTLELALGKAGLEVVVWTRPTWFFSANYLLPRLMRYLPFVNKLIPVNFFKQVTVPLNLRDSWLVIVRKKMVQSKVVLD